MSIITKDLYPSTKNFQKTNDDSVTFKWAMSYLSAIAENVSTAELATLRFDGWNAAWKVMKIHYDYVETQEEINARNMADIKAVLANVSKENGLKLTYEQVQELLAKL